MDKRTQVNSEKSTNLFDWYREYAYNALVSRRIGDFRDIPDTRHKERHFYILIRGKWGIEKKKKGLFRTNLLISIDNFVGSLGLVI